jgi:hypothetical protein
LKQHIGYSLYQLVLRNSIPPAAAAVWVQSTLFNAIVENGKAQAANFPFCTIEPNVGIVTVPDTRLDELSRIAKSRETVSEASDWLCQVKGA